MSNNCSSFSDNSGSGFGNSGVKGTYNVAFGVDVLTTPQNITTNPGTDNTAIGNTAMCESYIGPYNTAIGYQTLFTNSGTNNTSVGNNSMPNNASGSNNSSFGINSFGKPFKEH